MEELSANFGDIQLKLKFYPNENYQWELSPKSFSTKTFKALKKGIVALYSLEIISTLENETQEHIWPCLIFSSNKEEAKNELLDYLDESELLENLEKVWSIVLSENGPDWKINS